MSWARLGCASDVCMVCVWGMLVDAWAMSGACGVAAMHAVPCPHSLTPPSTDSCVLPMSCPKTRCSAMILRDGRGMDCLRRRPRPWSSLRPSRKYGMTRAAAEVVARAAIGPAVAVHHPLRTPGDPCLRPSGTQVPSSRSRFRT